MPPKSESPKKSAASLEELLKERDEKLRKLFIKVMNLHAGHQVGSPRSQSQLVAEVRKEIDQSLT
jgi:hypothetical protein